MITVERTSDLKDDERICEGKVYEGDFEPEKKYEEDDPDYEDDSD